MLHSVAHGAGDSCREQDPCKVNHRNCGIYGTDAYRSSTGRGDISPCIVQPSTIPSCREHSYRLWCGQGTVFYTVPQSLHPTAANSASSSCSSSIFHSLPLVWCCVQRGPADVVLYKEGECLSSHFFFHISWLSFILWDHVALSQQK